MGKNNEYICIIDSLFFTPKTKFFKKKKRKKGYHITEEMFNDFVFGNLKHIIYLST